MTKLLFIHGAGGYAEDRPLAHGLARELGMALEMPEPDTVLTLHHCRDDEIVPFGHLAVNARKLPSARVHEYAVGGHQFKGLLRAILAEAGVA